MSAHLPLIAVLWVLFWSLVLFVTMGADKRRARRAAFRVPEKTLFLLALLGGAPGGLAGMELFHHKTKHWTFVWGFRILTLVQLAGLLWLLSRT
ncbi:MAG: DUF1294 domain-containing protein [Oscillospiraceae bacterium]|nr:DUF1294 domain-containing protein [Oscillospiraceae bacterium]